MCECWECVCVCVCVCMRIVGSGGVICSDVIGTFLPFLFIYCELFFKFRKKS